MNPEVEEAFELFRQELVNKGLHQSLMNQLVEQERLYIDQSAAQFWERAIYSDFNLVYPDVISLWSNGRRRNILNSLPTNERLDRELRAERARQRRDRTSVTSINPNDNVVLDRPERWRRPESPSAAVDRIPIPPPRSPRQRLTQEEFNRLLQLLENIQSELIISESRASASAAGSIHPREIAQSHVVEFSQGYDEVLFIILGLIPVLGEAIDAVEFITGRDFFRGTQLTNTQKAFSAAAVSASFMIPFSGRLVRAGRIIPDGARIIERLARHRGASIQSFNSVILRLSQFSIRQGRIIDTAFTLLRNRTLSTSNQIRLLRQYLISMRPIIFAQRTSVAANAINTSNQINSSIARQGNRAIPVESGSSPNNSQNILSRIAEELQILIRDERGSADLSIIRNLLRGRSLRMNQNVKSQIIRNLRTAINDGRISVSNSAEMLLELKNFISNNPKYHIDSAQQSVMALFQLFFRIKTNPPNRGLTIGGARNELDILGGLLSDTNTRYVRGIPDGNRSAADFVAVYHRRPPHVPSGHRSEMIDAKHLMQDTNLENFRSRFEGKIQRNHLQIRPGGSIIISTRLRRVDLTQLADQSIAHLNSRDRANNLYNNSHIWRIVLKTPSGYLEWYRRSGRHFFRRTGN